MQLKSGLRARYDLRRTMLEGDLASWPHKTNLQMGLLDTRPNPGFEKGKSAGHKLTWQGSRCQPRKIACSSSLFRRHSLSMSPAG
ncbi:hypothetical protein SBA5_550048 [Candidatus Sulfotelmatomonas gaucii]|uniref:Uncharacterized protein n=1 Tax=Candidatus Sulfuritelmatomonas gaucii TaxID=2043161 RepID=A0A2N9LU07_9BACT|nr:hypothetical protein SBA5_550048 [Candidatus Sulfotelmatomonas gaucii]